MGFKDRLLQAKCKVGAHSGEWTQLATGSCDEQRTCVHCGVVSNRTEHHLSSWADSTDPDAPPCTRERRCERCPHVQQEVKHSMRPVFEYEGRHEICRARIECTQCGFTEGRTMMAHRWGDAVEFFDDDGRKKAYTCIICRARIVRDYHSISPLPDAYPF
jgi:hypothetical protein